MDFVAARSCLLLGVLGCSQLLESGLNWARQAKQLPGKPALLPGGCKPTPTLPLPKDYTLQGFKKGELNEYVAQ